MLQRPPPRTASARSAPSSDARPWGLFVAAFLSGAAALAAESLWVRRLGEILGSGIHAVAAVLTVFFFGLGLGARVIGRRADDLAAPVRLFAALELVIGVCIATFPAAARLLERVVATVAPAEWPFALSVAVKGALGGALLLLPCLAMGGTLPLLARQLVRADTDVAPRVGALYGLNTLGGAFGALAAVYVMLPELGVRGASLLAASTNVVAAALALLSVRSTTPVPVVSAAGAEPSSGRRVPAVLLASAVVSGFVGVALEVLWTRALSARFLGTVYSFATLLGVLLACMALGGLLAPLIARRRAGRRAYAALMIAAGLAALVSMLLVARVPGDLAYGIDRTRSFTDRQWHEARAAIAVMAAPCLIVGLAFPLLVALVHKETGRVGDALGRVYLANAVGTVLAPLVTTWLLLPHLGLAGSFLAAGWLAVGFGTVVLARWAGWRGKSLGLVGVLAFAPALLVSMTPHGDLRLWRHTDKDVLVDYEEGLFGALAVGKEPDGNVYLKLDNTYRLGDMRTRFAQQRQGLLPLLLHPGPASALFLGIGTGSSVGAAAALDAVHIDALDLVPELPDMLGHFASVNFDLSTRAKQGPAVRLLAADARHFVRATPQRYDVVVGDLFVPWRAGEGSMYTREHLAAVEQVLNPGGVFCQWLPLYQLRPDELRTITATFCEVFADVSAWWLYFNAEEPAIGLVGAASPLPFHTDSLFARMRGPGRAEVLGGAGYADPRSVLGCRIAGDARLREWSRGAPIETEERPRIEFEAPRGAFGDLPERSSRNLLEVLKLITPITTADPWFASLPEQVLQVVLGYQRGVSFYLRGRFADLYTADDREAMTSYAYAFQDIPDSFVSLVLEQAIQKAIRERELDLAAIGARAYQSVPQLAFVGHYYAAEVALAHGEREAAIAELRRALEANPDHADSARLLAEITAPSAGR